MITPREFVELKENVEAKKREADRASGAFDQALQQLKDKFDVNNIDEAKKLLEELTKKEQKAAEKLEKLVKEFKQDWSHVLANSRD